MRRGKGAFLLGSLALLIGIASACGGSAPQNPPQTVARIQGNGSCWLSETAPPVPAGQTEFSFGEEIGAMNVSGAPGFQVSPGELVYGTESQYSNSDGSTHSALNVFAKYDPQSKKYCQNYQDYFIDPFKLEELDAKGLVVRGVPATGASIPAHPLESQTDQSAQTTGAGSSQNGNEGDLPPLPPKIPYTYSSAILPSWQTVAISPSWLGRLSRFSEIPGALNFNGNGGTYDEWEGACHVARTLQNIEEFEQILGANYFNLSTPIPNNLTDPETGKICTLFSPLSRYGNAEILDAYLRNDKPALGIEIERYRRENNLAYGSSEYAVLNGLVGETSNGIGLTGYYQGAESYGLPVVLLLAIGETEHHNRDGNTFQCSLSTNPTGRESLDCALNHISGDISAMSSRYGPNSYAEAILAYNRGKSGAPIIIDALNALQ